MQKVIQKMKTLSTCDQIINSRMAFKCSSSINKMLKITQKVKIKTQVHVINLLT